MSALLAICAQTIRTSVRQRVFLLLLVLVILAVILLPLTVSGDGTANGEVQIILSYAFGMVTALLSAAALWIGCAAISREIEGYQMHLVLTAPAPRWLVWLGKWLGVFLLHAALFLVGALVILGMLHWRMAHWRFSPEETARVREEVLTGRREVLPLAPDFRHLVNDEYQRRLAAGELDPAHNAAVVRGELLRQVKARTTEIPAGATRLWLFRSLGRLPPDTPLYLRYRHYVGSTSRSDQKSTDGVWMVRDPDTADESYSVLPQRAMGGAFHELVIPARFVTADGTLVLGYSNTDPAGNSVIFQTADGPSLLVPATGFAANYGRAVLLVLLQLAVLAALGCTVSALFSTPVALFVAVAYLVMGFSVQAAVNVPTQDELEGYTYRGPVDRAAHVVALVTQRVIVSLGEFDASGDLTRGRLITGTRLARALLLLVGLRTVPLAALGMYVFHRRELGLVIRA